VHSEVVAVPRGMTVELTVERRRGLGLKRDVAEQVLQRANERLGLADRCERFQQGAFRRAFWREIANRAWWGVKRAQIEPDKCVEQLLTGHIFV